MPHVTETTTVTCPSCWTEFEIEVDCVAGSQDCYEDCPVCCNPVLVQILIGENAELLGTQVQPGND